LSLSLMSVSQQRQCWFQECHCQDSRNEKCQIYARVFQEYHR
jgi:hypothetical protein